MRYLVSFLGTLLRIALQSVALSALFIGVLWVLHIAGLSDREVTWLKFLFGAIGIFILLTLYAVLTTATTLYRMHKDPAFKDAHLMTGISWKDYKRIKGKNK